MKDSVVAEVKIIPLGTGTSVSQLVADCVSLLETADGIKYKVGPMSTTVEGPLDTLLELVKAMHEVPFAKGAERVVTSFTVDDRRDKRITMDGKVSAVEEKLNG